VIRLEKRDRERGGAMQTPAPAPAMGYNRSNWRRVESRSLPGTFYYHDTVSGENITDIEFARRTAPAPTAPAPAPAPTTASTTTFEQYLEIVGKMQVEIAWNSVLYRKQSTYRTKAKIAP